jgi:c-di-GMP-binding flagellar brake protein YcgR
MDGQTTDISAGGAFIRCEEPLKLKEFFEMTISVSPLSPRIKAIAEVVWSNVSDLEAELQSRGMGVRFFKMSDEDRKVISALISDHLISKGINWRRDEAEK